MSWGSGNNSDNGAKIDWDAYNDLNNNNNKSEDRGVIEVPAGSESVIYQDEEGNYYEISIGELEDYDDEGEIEHSKSSSTTKRITAKSKKTTNINKPILHQYTYQTRYNSFKNHIR